MRITYFNYVWDIEGISAGAATKAKEIIGGINKLGHDATIFWRTPQPNGEAKITDKVKDSLKPELQKYLHEPKKLARNLPYFFQEYHILKGKKPDILFSRLELYNCTGTWLSKVLNIPLAVEADCPPSYEHKNFFGKEFFHVGNVSEKLELQTLRNADAVIAISNILKNYYVEQGIASEKIHVIPNGADPDKFCPQEKPKELVEKYNLQDKIVIGWIGALVGWSGIESLLKTAVHILENYPNVAFMMIGGGPNQDLFRKELHIRDFAPRVILSGSLPHVQIPDYLACMDVVLAPYPRLPFWYASSMKIFEYMAAGKALVASDVGQVSDIIRDGHNGLLFDPDNTDELAKKIILLLENEPLRKQIGEQARQDLLQNYTWEHHAKQIIAIFEEVLGRKNNLERR